MGKSCRAKGMKKILVLVMCSALLLGEIPAGITEAKSDGKTPKIVLEGSVDEHGGITLTAELVDAAKPSGSYKWLQIDGRTHDVSSTAASVCKLSSLKLDELYAFWKTDKKLEDSTEGFQIVSSYTATLAAVSAIEVKENYSWSVNDAKDKAELEIDSFDGVSTQDVSGTASTDGTILGVKNGMQILDGSGNDVTSNNGGLSKGDYVVACTYSGDSAKITVKAEYKIEVQQSSESSAPSDTTSPSADPSEAATAAVSPTDEPTFVVPTQTPDIGEPPVEQPTAAPTTEPTKAPGVVPTVNPTTAPTAEADPTETPEAEPTKIPAVTPTKVPEAEPTKAPADPTAKPDAVKNKTVTVGKVQYKVDAKAKSAAYEKNAAKADKVTVPGTVKVNGVRYPVTKISNGAFRNSKVKKVTLGKNVTSVGVNSFKGCTKLTKVSFPAKLQKVEAGAFSGCTKLQSASLPNATKKIGANAFKNCKSLKKLTIGKTSKKKRDASVLFGAYAQSKILFAVPDSTKVTIGAGALENCAKLRSVIINSQVTRIGSRTFQHCKELARVLVKSLKLQAVGNNALKGVNNCKISVPTIRLRKYRTLFKNKGQGRKVVIAKV